MSAGWFVIAAIAAAALTGLVLLNRMGSALKRVEDERKDREDW